MSLTKRNGVYYAQLSVPADVRHIIGKSNFRRTTGCRTQNAALLEAAPWLEEWRRQIELARQQPDALLEEIAVLKARAEMEKRDPEVARDERGYLPAENEIESRGLDDFDWLDTLPPSQAAKYANILWGDGVPLPHFAEQFIAANYGKRKARAEARRYILEATLHIPTLEKLGREGAKAWIRAEAVKPAEERRAVATMQKATGYLSEYILWLQDQRLLSDAVENPFRDLRYPKALRAKESYVPLSLDEILAIRAAAMDLGDTEVAAFIDIARYTGMRIAEVGALSSTSVELIDGIRCLRVKEDAKTKASAGRLVPVAATLSNLLASNGYSLDSFDLGRRENAVGKRFGRLKTAVLPDGKTRTKCFHSIRKYVATTLEQGGVPEGVAADLVGHEKQTMTYGVYSGGSGLMQLTKAVEALEAAQPTPDPSNVVPLRERQGA
ncbi:MAG: tyrosine-type recombinase/integrase [Pseudomonadota bacterium]|nr:tyrosine-type recombinase/integrase [Pseudomonadota bacterium]